MIYIIRVPQDSSEIEVASTKTETTLHLKQGIEEPDGEINFKSFMNIELSSKQTLDLIKSLQLALSELED